MGRTIQVELRPGLAVDVSVCRLDRTTHIFIRQADEATSGGGWHFPGQATCHPRDQFSKFQGRRHALKDVFAQMHDVTTKAERRKIATVLLPTVFRPRPSSEARLHLSEARAEISRLQNELADFLADAFCQIAHKVRLGGREGWWDTCALTTAVEYGDRLVDLGLWEKHEHGWGRRWFYRPLEREENDQRGET